MHAKVVVLYIHGMGGGSDSRIPSILKAAVPAASGVEIVVRTYSFDPELGAAQIAGWVEELHPALVVGESLGALQALRIHGVPHIFVSPSLNAPLYLGGLCWLTLIPGMTPLLDWIYKPKEGDRQPLHFTFRTLRKYLAHRRAALQGAPRFGGKNSFFAFFRSALSAHGCIMLSFPGKDSFFAFFGTRDHYRRSGVVSIRTWRKYYGDTYAVYDGTHYMEEEFVVEMLLFKIFDTLKIKL